VVVAQPGIGQVYCMAECIVSKMELGMALIRGCCTAVKSVQGYTIVGGKESLLFSESTPNTLGISDGYRFRQSTW
jgi:hypothetical protein